MTFLSYRPKHGCVFDDMGKVALRLKPIVAFYLNKLGIRTPISSVLAVIRTTLQPAVKQFRLLHVYYRL